MEPLTSSTATHFEKNATKNNKDPDQKDKKSEHSKSKVTFTPPPEVHDSCIEKAFKNTIPDVTKICKCGILKSTPCCKKLNENIDNILIVTLVIAVVTVIFCAVALFFVGVGTAQTAFLTTGLIAGGLSMLLGGSYIKRFLVLRKIQEEVKVLRLYKDELEKLIKDRNEAIEKLTQQGVEYERLNKEQKELINERITQEKAQLEQHQKYAKDMDLKIKQTEKLLERQKATTSQLEQAKGELEEQIQKMKEHHAYLKDEGGQLFKQYEATVIKLREERADLERINTQLKTRNEEQGQVQKQIQEELQEHRKEKAEVEARIRQLNTELDEKIKRLEQVTQDLEQSARSGSKSTQQTLSETAAGAMV